MVSTYPERAKTANARRDPRVSVVVLSDDLDGPWVQVDGTAEVLDLPEALEPLVDYYRSISGEHPDWDEYRAAMRGRASRCCASPPSAGARSPPAASPPGWPEGRPAGMRTARPA